MKQWIKYDVDGSASPVTFMSVARAYARDVGYPLEFAIKETRRLESDYFPEISVRPSRGKVYYRFEEWENV